MKTLLILRHAKTQPDAPRGDHARELTARGHRDAAAMGAHIAATFGPPDAIVTSDARRAVQTAEIVATAVGFTAPLTVEPRIYAAEASALLDVVRHLPESSERVVLVGHNPGFEELAESLADDDAEVRLPTSGLAHIELDIPAWSAAKKGKGRLRDIATRHTIGASPGAGDDV
jgi:phosphohistidine phosphatase